MNADRLREAARVLRERAEAATPGPWTTGAFKGDTEGIYVLPADPESHHYISHGGDPNDDADAPYIAIMHPGVGLALADWLAAEAAAGCAPEQAFQIADLILGGAS